MSNTGPIPVDEPCQPRSTRTTDIVDQVESQVAGRAGRYGREYNLRVRYVLQDDKIIYMSQES